MFEMGAKFEDGWNLEKEGKKQTKQEIKTPEKHLLHFAKEKRRGKTVIIVKAFFLEKKELQALLKKLKKQLGTGGTLKESSLEFQGEVQESLKTALTEQKFRFKK
ncbi:MAG: translation initiation factor [Epsilonproteobacteria bacterium]|nr:translation initiation factor [Campylobacterota bacterium]